MNGSNSIRAGSRKRYALALVLGLVSLAGASGCSRFYKSKVTVPPLLAPLKEAAPGELIEVVNRLAQVRSLRGKIDIQFLDTSFAQCGVTEKYRTAEGDVILQRDGQIYLVINGPFSVKIAEMASDGERFRVAVLKGDDKWLRFLKGTNTATYQRIDSGAEVDCGKGDQKKTAQMQQRAASAFSGLRPQHFTDALLVRPVSPGTNLVYVRSEAFAEDTDTRPNAKRGARVVRGYYQLDELAPDGDGRARLLRRFWFDRYGEIALARLQTFGERGELTTDVIYRNPKTFGETTKYTLPADIEITRPQDRYSLRISYQVPEAVKVDQPWPSEVFVLENKSNLPEVDLDAKKQ
ncbi:MAG: hypothetical protein QOD32_1520 [Pyrinomonadaceae bacterium]|jgi:hypothetical protein|nr:hypothetical protein [Pyrinomonadaceae bacterium]